MRIPSSIRSRLGFLTAGAAIAAGLYVVMIHALASDISESDAAAAQRSGRPSKQPTREPLEHDQRTALLQRRVTALESDLTALRGERELEPRDPAARGASDTATPPQPDATDLQAGRDQEEARIFAQIGRSFRSQPVDPAWSAAMTDRITEHLRAQPLEKSSVENIECRYSLCRIDIEVDPGADLAMIRDSLRFRVADVTGSGASKRDETGKFIIYLAKDAQALGMAPQP